MQKLVNFGALESRDKMYQVLPESGVKGKMCESYAVVNSLGKRNEILEVEVAAGVLLTATLDLTASRLHLQIQ